MTRSGKRIGADGDIEWRNQFGQPHRIGTPALIWDDGESVWIRNGKRDRPDEEGKIFLWPRPDFEDGESRSEFYPDDDDDDDDWDDDDDDDDSDDNISSEYWG
jgi:hypothetical protein